MRGGYGGIGETSLGSRLTRIKASVLEGSVELSLLGVAGVVGMLVVSILSFLSNFLWLSPVRALIMVYCFLGAIAMLMLEGIHHPTAAGDSCAPRLGRARVVLYQEMHFLTTLTGRAVAYAFFGSLMLANSNSWLGWLVGIYLFCIAAAMIFVGCRSTAKLEGLAAVSEHELGERFDAYDADHDGKLTRDQLVALCSDLGTILTPRELESALNLLDADDQGTVEKSVFLAWCSGDNWQRSLLTGFRPPRGAPPAAATDLT